MDIWYRTGSLGSRSSVTRLELFSGKNFTETFFLTFTRAENIALKFRNETMFTIMNYIFQLCIRDSKTPLHD